MGLVSTRYALCINDRLLTDASSRLEKNWNEKTIAALVKDQPRLDDPEALAAFKRKWEYMYVYAEVGYARAYTSMHYFTFVRPVSTHWGPSATSS